MKFTIIEATNENDLKDAPVRHMDTDEMRKCPHIIIMPVHYRMDGTCRCNDPTHTEMRVWGYEWKDDRWVSTDVDFD